MWAATYFKLDTWYNYKGNNKLSDTKVNAHALRPKEAYETFWIAMKVWLSSIISKPVSEKFLKFLRLIAYVFKRA